MSALFQHSQKFMLQLLNIVMHVLPQLVCK